jgi:hypothetical protein
MSLLILLMWRGRWESSVSRVVIVWVAVDGAQSAPYLAWIRDLAENDDWTEIPIYQEDGFVRPDDTIYNCLTPYLDCVVEPSGGGGSGGGR